MFIDKDTYLIAFSDISDPSGALWKVWINESRFRHKALPNAQYIYDSPFPFGPSMVMADAQLQHATKAALPSLAYPGEQGWYFNKGAVVGDTEDFFTIGHMIESSH